VYTCEVCGHWPCTCKHVVPPGHPWADFLNARARVIDWLYYREGPCMHDDAAIATTLSMDPVQVMLIRRRDEKPGDNRGQVKHVRRSGDA
jgi:hypothetical protein